MGREAYEGILKHFREISKIPRKTGKEKEISDYLVRFAKQRELEVRQDEHYNVVIKKNSTVQNCKSKTVIIQGHMDMVYERDEDCKWLYEDGIKIIEKDGYLYGDGTTLGADNGIALAYAMEILASKEIVHPNIEVVITVQEEKGMVGAKKIDVSDLKGRYFINLDAEREGSFYTSCAGGVSNYVHIEEEKMIMKTSGFSIITIDIHGLKGGHSGTSIGLERANAIKLMGRLLQLLDCEELHIVSIDGKGKGNVISRGAAAVICVPGSEASNMLKNISMIEKMFKDEYQYSDNIDITTRIEKAQNELEAYTKACKNKIINTIMLLPQGITHMSFSMPGFVESSVNLGSLECIDGRISLLSSIRSSVETRKKELINIIRTIANVNGLKCEFFNDYPQWAYKQESKLRELCISKYEELFGKRAVASSVHAGLECGYFDHKINKADMISFGPDIKNAHTTQECVNIESIKNIWILLVCILENIQRGISGSDSV
ncbi:MAG: beta-Ala-His dipeptidase [Clostridiaceae bacterium]|nr:beta-Ala-His dipeptidase [Clostridiaceae bacterium]